MMPPGCYNEIFENVLRWINMSDIIGKAWIYCCYKYAIWNIRNLSCIHKIKFIITKSTQRKYHGILHRGKILEYHILSCNTLCSVTFKAVINIEILIKNGIAIKTEQ